MSLRPPSSLLRTASATASSSSSSNAVARAFSTSAAAQVKPRRQRDLNDPFILRNLQTFEYDDIPTLGHLMLQRRRELLKYVRLTESEMPKLQQFASAYKPPSSDSVLRVRSHHYQGETHPSTRKAVVTVTLADLQRIGALKSDAALHKFKLLAGTRYDVATDSVKVACERFAEEAQNVRWAAERVEMLVQEANTSPEDYASVPLDDRHALVREAKRNGLARKSSLTVKDFPKEWL